MGAEFLKYEKRDLARPDEVEDFVLAVDRLRDDVERAAARLKEIAEGIAKGIALHRSAPTVSNVGADL
jgi:ubiquinone biosynthesis protein UbiJ